MNKELKLRKLFDKEYKEAFIPYGVNIPTIQEIDELFKQWKFIVSNKSRTVMLGLEYKINNDKIKLFTEKYSSNNFKYCSFGQWSLM
jgi:hypothetical protein